MKAVMNDMMLAREVSNIDFYKFYSTQQHKWYQRPIISDKSIEWSAVEVTCRKDSGSSLA